jgi:hypothetical protein
VQEWLWPDTKTRGRPALKPMSHKAMLQAVLECGAVTEATVPPSPAYANTP